MGRHPKQWLPLTELQQQRVIDSICLINKAAHHRFRRFHANLTLDDLKSASALGVIYAAAHYVPDIKDDVDRRWRPYALRCADAKILDDINSCGLIVVPQAIYKKVGKEKVIKAKIEMYDPPIRIRRGRNFDRWKWIDADRALIISSLDSDSSEINDN